jgi:Gluconate 2-dehydrogenase subunit 3
MTDDDNRYPNYDVLTKRETMSWNAATRRVIDRRLAVPRRPRFFKTTEWATLQALCARILPQPGNRPAVPLAAYVDQRLIEGRGDGYRFASMPNEREAWQRGLAALDAEAQSKFGKSFHAIDIAGQDELIGQMQRGELHDPAWGDMPQKTFFAHRVIPDITHAYYAHPSAWNEIGFGGPASPRGYVRMGLDRRDPWEAAEAHPGEEVAAARKNARVG